ncbi:MAG: pirin family protein [Verrucomicrobia bacterium]|nr:pirin family protein [Verrucomicrobiota bacterium]
MITVRKSAERGHLNHGWLDTFHTFSFGDYYDPKYTNFGDLRVINEDTVMPGFGFDTHPHSNMEIVTYIIEGALEHKDSGGHGMTIKAGEVQRMTAGSGIEHSEKNASKTEPVHLLQIWIYPEKKGLPPSYEQRVFTAKEKTNRLCPIVGEVGLKIHQDATIYASLLSGELVHTVNPKRRYWIQVVKGSLQVSDKSLSAGDGAAIEKESSLKLVGKNAEFLLFDLP